jgi:hypothetical protein
MRPSLATKYVGWEESLSVIVDGLERHQPDGILGGNLHLCDLHAQSARIYQQ